MNVTIQAKIAPRKPDEPSILQGGYLKLAMKSDYVELLTQGLKGYKGGDLDITFSDDESWTQKMNRLFHAIIRDIVASDAVQYWQLLGRAPIGFDEVKEWCKVQFGGAEVKIVGSLSFIESWKDFGKKRALQTIDSMIHYCTEQGVDIDAHKLEADVLRRK